MKFYDRFKIDFIVVVEKLGMNDGFGELFLSQGILVLNGKTFRILRYNYYYRFSKMNMANIRSLF